MESGELTQAEGHRLLHDLIDAVVPPDNPRGAPVPSNLRLRQKLQQLATDIFDEADRDDAEALFFDTFVGSPEAQEVADLIFGFFPGLGEAMSARDAYEGFLAALQAAEDIRVREALLAAGGAGIAAIGAIPILGKAVRLTRDGARAGVAATQMLRRRISRPSKRAVGAGNSGSQLSAFEGRSEPIEGIYEFRERKSGLKYVGQSNNIRRRISQHLRVEKLDRKDLGKVRITEVRGGKLAREIAEQRRLDELTGGVPARLSNKVANKLDPIGPLRRHLMKE